MGNSDQHNNPPSSSLSLGALARALEEQARLSRFFTKLLSEAFHLQTDSVLLRTVGDSLSVSMRREKDEVKSISIKSTWLIPLCQWLAQRPNILSEEVSGSPPDSADRRLEPGAQRRAWSLDCRGFALDFEAACRCGDEVAIFSVVTSKGAGGTRTLSLSNLRKLPLQNFIDRLGMTGTTRLLFEQILSVESGLVVVAAPNSDQLSKNLASLLSLSKLNVAGDISDSSIRPEIALHSRTEAFFLTASADDAVDAVFKLREQGADMQATQIAGVLCQGFVRKNCPACSRKASPEKALSEQVPQIIRPENWNSYAVGRGCEACGQRGYQGLIGIQSFLGTEGEPGKLIKAGADRITLIQSAYAVGTRALLEDGIAKAVSGQLTLEALFEVTRALPVAYVEYGLSKTAKSKGEVMSSPGQAGHREKPLVLVVEDDPDQRAILEMVLRTAGYEIASVEHGKAALELLQRSIPDLIISDLMMPEMDGVELVTKLKSDPQLRQIPILILTVVSDSDKEYSLLDLGADDYVEKTVQRKILLKRAEKLLNRARGA